MLKRLIPVIALACAYLPAHAEDYAALLDEAIATIDWEFDKEWAFTESSLEEDQLWVGRFDPRLEDDAQWTLISVDGLEPTDKQRREYRHNKDEHRSESDDDDNQVTAIVEPDSLELLEETDDYWSFSFVPDDNEAAFIENVDATVKIIKDGHYIESINIHNRADIRPGWGTKISKFLMQLEFGPATQNGPIVPHRISVHVTGRALLFIGFDETEVTKYSEFEHAVDSTGANL